MNDTKEKKYTILLFYKYTNIEDPEKLKDDQLKLCEKLDLKGRIIVAKEGINATLEGENENISQYLKTFLSDKRFSDTHIKKSVGTGDAFPKLSIKVRDEIVSLHLGGEDINPNEMTGKRLSADELKEWFDKKEDFVIVDMRNDYEHKIGHFKNSILPPLKNFRDLPERLENIDSLKNRKVLTVCTGGVRCEKASGYLVKNGFSNVYQLDGGIVTYMEKYPAQEFLGTLYVFDRRVTMDFDPKDKHTVIGKCDICSSSSERYVNCKNKKCNKHFICCTTCYSEEESPYCIDCKKIFE